MYVPEKDCSEKFHQIRKVTPAMETVLNKAAGRLQFHSKHVFIADIFMYI